MYSVNDQASGEYGRGFGFTSAAAVRFAKPQIGAGSEQIRTLLERRNALPEMAAVGVDVGVPLDSIFDKGWSLIPLQFKTQRPFRLSEAIEAAASVVAYLHSNASRIEQVLEVREDAAPAIASSGAMFWPTGCIWARALTTNAASFWSSSVLIARGTSTSWPYAKRRVRAKPIGPVSLPILPNVDCAHLNCSSPMALAACGRQPTRPAPASPNNVAGCTRCATSRQSFRRSIRGLPTPR